MGDQVRKGRDGGSPGSSGGGLWLLFQVRWEGLGSFGAEEVTESRRDLHFNRITEWASSCTPTSHFKL